MSALQRARGAAKRLELMTAEIDSDHPAFDVLQYEADIRSEHDAIAAFSLLSIAETLVTISDTLTRVGARI